MLHLDKLNNLGKFTDKVPCVIMKDKNNATLEFVKVKDFHKYQLIKNYDKGFPKIKKVN
jgi:hypothetical protein